jgi:phage-related protein
LWFIRNFANIYVGGHRTVPRTKIIFYCEENGTVPVLDWLRSLPPKAQDKCVVRIERLAELGYELRRPEADLLRDKIYELRVGLQGQNYRILYFFHGTIAAVLAHGLVKERAVPPADIERTIERRLRFEANPETHTYVGEGGSHGEN